jgi:hypothetical protein
VPGEGSGPNVCRFGLSGWLPRDDAGIEALPSVQIVGLSGYEIDVSWWVEPLTITKVVNPSHMDLLLPPARLGDVVGSLHPHERVHLHAKGFLNAEGHVPGRVSLAICSDSGVLVR